MSWIHTLKHRLVVLLAAVLMLTGCKEVLYSELSEADANEMVALLVLSGIPASRERSNSLTYSVTVDEADLAVAVTVLKNSGLPREKYATFGDVFGDSGVVGTPFEERVRFAYATNEELSHTISQIKGVERARVHVVVPAEERFGKIKEPARAAVAVFHDKSFQPPLNAGQIKTLVAYSVPGLEVEAVSLSFFLAPGFVVEPNTDQVGNGTAMAQGDTTVVTRDSTTGFPLIEILMVVVALFVLRSFVLMWRSIFARRAK